MSYIQYVKINIPFDRYTKQEFVSMNRVAVFEIVVGFFVSLCSLIEISCDSYTWRWKAAKVSVSYVRH